MLKGTAKKLFSSSYLKDISGGNYFIPAHFEKAPPIGGYDLWVDASDLDTIIIDTSNRVLMWLDKSSSKNHLFTDVTATANMPTYTTRTVAGVVCPEFDGSNDYFRTNHTAADITQTGFVVALTDNTNATRSLWSGNTNSTNQFRMGTTGKLETVKEGIINIFLSTVNTLSASTAFQATQVLSATTCEHRLNGTSESGSHAQTFTASIARIGTRSTTAESWDGLIAEILMYPTTLSSGEILEVEAYLKNKWGTP